VVSACQEIVQLCLICRRAEQPLVVGESRDLTGHQTCTLLRRFPAKSSRKSTAWTGGQHSSEPAKNTIRASLRTIQTPLHTHNVARLTNQQAVAQLFN